MTINTFNDADGRRRFVLGPMEVAIASAIPTALLALLIWLASASVARLDKYGTALENVAIQQAVMTAQLAAVAQTLADVPALTRQAAENKVRLDRHDEDLRELRGTKGLR